MALLNGMLIFVESENTGRNINITSHPIEKDIPTTDHVKRDAATLDISGIIPPPNAEEIRQKIVALASGGHLVTFSNANYYKDVLIANFTTEHTNKVKGGMRFNMSLQEVFFSKSPYDANKRIAAKQTVQQSKSTSGEYVIHVVKKGDTIWDLCIKNNAPYKKYGFTVKQVIDLSPECFSRKTGSYDYRARSMQIGAKLRVGKR